MFNRYYLGGVVKFEEMINQIITGDCLEVMKDIPDKSIDLVLTDPPYGIKRDKGFEGFGGFGGFGKKIARRQYPDCWDSERPSKAVFDEILRVSKLAIIFGGNFFADILPISTHWLVWDKLNTMPTFGDCELAYTNSQRKSVKKYTVEYNGLLGKEDDRYHPTQKPILLMKKILLDYTEKDALVLDCFLGSGTTAVACKELDRRFIGIEKEPKYVAITKERLRVLDMQPKLF
jgi:DNA modification methylase